MSAARANRRPRRRSAGKVTVVSPAVDPNTTTVEVWVQAENPGERLRPGGTVRVAIIAETIQNTMVVPAAALLNSDEGGQQVMVIDENSWRMSAKSRWASVKATGFKSSAVFRKATRS